MVSKDEAVVRAVIDRDFTLMRVLVWERADRMQARATVMIWMMAAGAIAVVLAAVYEAVSW